jgi:hypothetical protein
MSRITLIKSNIKKNSPIYIVDFLNIFSDFREIKYKMSNVDFHSVKHVNKEKDTLDFFKIFFTKYISYTGIKSDGNFLFVMKKITNYDNVLYKVLELYEEFNIRFIIIESKYELDILDKNKDDFLCQYIFSYLISSNDNCILISNDKYRDREIYVKEFSNNSSTFIRVLKKTNNNNLIESALLNIDIETILCNKILTQICKRCTIPKNKLRNIL